MVGLGTLGWEGDVACTKFSLTSRGLENFGTIGAHFTGKSETATNETVRYRCRLCAPGWKVCEAADKHMLGSITWEDATTLTGCYAFNAAQDGGQCRPCINHVEQVRTYSRF